MYNKGKYVIGKVKSRSLGSALSAVCVNEIVSHVDLADLFVEGSVTSAGFFHLSINRNEAGLDPTVKCYGESVTLGIKSLPSDVEHIMKALGLQGPWS